MRARVLAGLLTAVTGLLSVEAHAAPLATVPVTSGIVSGAGLTATGAPLIGTPTKSILRFGGGVTLGVFVADFGDRIQPDQPGRAVHFASAISGTLPASSSLSWACLCRSRQKPVRHRGPDRLQQLHGPEPRDFGGLHGQRSGSGGPERAIRADRVADDHGPTGDAFSFNSEVTATSNAVPEPGSLAVLGIGLMGLGLIASRKRGVRAAAEVAGPIEHY